MSTWDFYFLNVDDKPASIYVNLGAIDAAPNPHYPHMAYIRLHMQAPREDGLSSQSEYDVLVTIEDHLVSTLVNENTQYLGRCTTNACRDFFFYLTDAHDWSLRTATCMNAFDGYQYQADTREEPDWSTYHDYLYPSEADKQTMQNRHVCDALAQQGDQLEAPREIEHWAYFPSNHALDLYVMESRQLGYEVRTITKPGENHDQYGVQLWRSDVPAYNCIDEVTLPLFYLAVKHGGEYDGWESVIIR
ncbi:DUF695 domain-containing protein [Chitinimonas viridis]|uniref:DUF695 domain-containing protein n=1 Tax=Chitinimonas viridis TaxID=664880 RepID=A0ABT8B0Y5_9NEIS|nr:DUF695 domain-containing protein [Chitinimonas viridis]MDN3575704.1 DUF695 domain-containing protein [Chitinimonas viridis]